jgi:TetR/AcrR family transcriptional regulator, transcriptional repressor for nem operon
MVKVSKDVSQKNRHDLLQAAGQAMRAQGIFVASVGAIAAEVGLTHGAIYRQFPSKDALAAAAIGTDFDRITALLADISAKGGSLAAYFQAYLATDHRDHFVWGCPVAPLAAEISRSGEQVQTAFAEGLQRNLAAIAELSGIQDPGDAQAYAIYALATLSGAMAMARATRTCQPALSQDILAKTLQSLLGDPRLKAAAQPN